MNGREMERRDFANRLSASGVGSGQGGRGAGGQGGRGMGGGRGRWTRTRKPKIWIASAQGQDGQGRARQGRTSAEQDKQGRTGRTGPGRAEQTATCSQQPATLKQLTAEGGDHRATHLAHRSTCCSRTASRERASAEGLESIEGLRVSVSLCLRVFTSSRLPALLHLCTASIAQGGAQLPS